MGVAAAVVMVLTACAGGDAAGPPPAPTAEAVVPAPPLDAAELEVYGGVARVDLASSCTASLVETGVDTAPAYLLTNGHCIGLDTGPANRTVVDEEGFGQAHFFAVAGAAEADVLDVPVVRFEYGTMRGIDVAVVRLDATLGELRAAGAVPLSVGAAVPAEGLDVVNIAAPTQNVMPEEWVLRKGECTLGATADVIEGRWLWFDAPRNDCPGVLGGSSGSPLIAGGEIVALLNTTNTGVPVERGDTCYLGKPCEVDGDAAVFVPDTSYGTQVAGVGDCFVDGVFALDGGCPLPVTTLWDIDGGGIFGADGTDGIGLEPELALRGDTAEEVAVIQNVALGDASRCTDPVAYADASRVTLVPDAEEPVVVPITLPTENGFVLACAAVPGQEQLAARFVFSIDAVPPAFGPQLLVEDVGDAIMIDPLFDLPDISEIWMLYGSPDEVDCADRDAYASYRRQPVFLDKSELPARFCAVGFDLAGNESPITDQMVE
ncbi:MAG: trypsin-like serine peptidase [Microbacterium sp.]|uniref:trypsin-like serine peptidase n=1 Tax=Microbacterium sp. TaxID=51671 RepID=UPI003A8A711E